MGREVRLMIPVHLTNYELFSAAMVGSKRQIAAIAKHLPDKHGYDGEGWNVHIEGAAGEIAVAKALGLYWNGSVNTFKVGGDVSGIEVRTRSRADYDLLIRPEDRDDAIYVLVVGRSPQFNVVGWIRGRDAKQARFLQTHGGRPAAYFVPQSELESDLLAALMAMAPRGVVS